MNEFELIDMLTVEAKRSSRDIVCGIGDDCAVMRAGDRDLLITTDALVEDVHFKLAYTDEHDLGGKMLGVNISDVAAMGGTPRFFLVALNTPPSFDPKRLKLLYDGIYAMARLHDIELIGGDTTAGPVLAATITLIGECNPGGALLRSGARAGDAIYVTGELGSAAMGLVCLEWGWNDSRTCPFVERHRSVAPRVTAGRWLATTGMTTAMIDISDGLVADVGHLALAGKTGYDIDVDAVPHHPDLRPMADALGLDYRALMLAGGDDYELAFTVAAAHEDEFDRLVNDGGLPFDHGMTKIGRMTSNMSQRSLKAHDGTEVPLASGGFDHFRNRVTGV